MKKLVIATAPNQQPRRAIMSNEAPTPRDIAELDKYLRPIVEKIVREELDKQRAPVANQSNAPVYEIPE